MPTTWTHPYRVVRSFSTLDHLSRGRAGWNIVFSNTPAAARAYGRERPLTSDEYYALADEYIDVAYKLWEGSWDEGAVVADKDARVYVEPGTVHSIEHSGEHFSVDAANYVDPGPQRLPVLAQASGTARGTAFAAKNAELILVGGPTREYCAENIRGIHAGRRRGRARARLGEDDGAGRRDRRADPRGGPGEGRRVRLLHHPRGRARLRRIEAEPGGARRRRRCSPTWSPPASSPRPTASSATSAAAPSAT